jgi:hypothetical protein
MKHDIYISAKEALKYTKGMYKNCSDKPLVRQVLNDTTDALEREIRANYSLSEKLQELYCKWLVNYCVTLHP